MPNSLQLKKNGVDISSSVEWRTFQLQQVLTKEVSKAQFNIKVAGSNVSLALGDQVDIYQNTVHIFGGTVTEKNLVVMGGILPQVQYLATDWSFNLDTKLVHKNYANMDPADIVADIITTYTDGTYTIANVQRGNFLVPSIKFNYQPVTKCLEKLATVIGWEWYVDPSKDVHFFLVENNPAPFDINDTQGNIEWPSLNIAQDLTNMKNSVYVIGGLYTKLLTSSSTPDIYKGDGTKKVFSLAYAYNFDSHFVVTKNGVAQTTGEENQITVPGSVDVLYNSTNRYVRFTAASAPLSTDEIRIYGNARIPILAHKTDPAAIIAYGEKQDSIIDKQITTVAEAQARAQAEITLYGHAVYVVKFNTIQAGLAIAQQINLNSVVLGFTNIPLTIRRLTAQGYGPNDLRWSIEAYGSDQVNFTDIISYLLQKENNLNDVLGDTILETLLSLEETLTIAEVLTVKPPQRGPYFWG